MKLLLLLSCLAATKAGVSQRCAGPVIGGVHYSDEVLKSGLRSPTHLNFENTTNSLYFANHFESNHACKLDLDTKVSKKIDFDHGVHCVTVDPETSDLFIGSNVGIFKYNKNINNTELYGANGIGIKQLFAKHGVIYFTTYDSGDLSYQSYVYKVVYGNVYRLEDLKDTKVNSFIIDNDNYIVFANNTGVFRQKLGTEDTICYSTAIFIRGFTIKTDGDVYAANSDGIYFVNKQNHTFDQIVAVKRCRGVAFDSKNNIIYADEKSIHRLKPSESQECV